ncbi:hypothetical protein ACF065_06855 [Streptomyces sp. NPDC015232]|uniref:hypothetical protein n=1 Tax=unclassified Streptomyces TaxID=2593676 RepID=UPI0033E1BA28
MARPEREDRTADTVPESVPMRELLASCAAASAVSTPPRRPAAPEHEEPAPSAPPVVDDRAA